MCSWKRNLLCISIVLGLFLSNSALSAPTVLAQLPPTYRLGVSEGYSATYDVDEIEAPGLHLAFQQGDTIRVQLEDRYLISIIDKTNSDAFSYEVPTLSTYVNDVPTDLGSVFQYLLRLGGDFGPSLGPFFYPTGVSFWYSLASYLPYLEVNSADGNRLTIISESFLHYRVESGNTSYESYYDVYARADVDPTTGIASRIEGKLSAIGSNQAYMTMTLVNTNILPTTSWYFLFAPIFVVGALLLLFSFGSRRKVVARGTRKEEILIKLSSGELLRLAEAVPGVRVDARMSRANLVKMIKDSLSLDEIKAKLREAA